MNKEVESLVLFHNYQKFLHQRICQQFLDTAKEDPERITNILGQSFFNGECKLDHVEDTIVYVYLNGKIKFIVSLEDGLVLPTMHQFVAHELEKKFYNTHWPNTCVIDRLSRDALVSIFGFLTPNEKQSCMRVSRKFSVAARSNLLWEDPASVELAKCKEFVRRRPDLNFFHQYLYYSFSTNQILIPDDEYAKMMGKFFLKPENEEMLRGLASQYSIGRNIVIWRRDELTKSMKKRRVEQPQFSKRRYDQRPNPKTLNNLLLAVYFPRDPSYPEIWITKSCKFRKANPFSKKGTLSPAEIRDSFLLRWFHRGK